MGGLNARLLQVLEKGVEVPGGKEVASLQGDGPVPAGEEQAGLHLGGGDQVALGGTEKEGVLSQPFGVGKVVRGQFLIDFSLWGGFQKHSMSPVPMGLITVSPIHLDGELAAGMFLG